MKLTVTLLMSCLTLTSCGINMNGISGRERTEYLASIKPYGAHWIKDGMTRETRLSDFTKCGGSSNLKEGYELQQGQPTADFFDKFNFHVLAVKNCMETHGYAYISKCDARCMHP